MEGESPPLLPNADETRDKRQELDDDCNWGMPGGHIPFWESNGLTVRLHVKITNKSRRISAASVYTSQGGDISLLSPSSRDR